MNDRRIAEIWPSQAALQEELSRRARAQSGAGGLLLCPSFYTFDTLLPELLAQAPLPNGNKPLLPLAGPMLVQGLLRGSGQKIYVGLAAGRRLPERLWRLLVEIKAAGLDSNDLESLGSGDNSRFGALAKLMAGYEQGLREKGLADQADQLAALERMLQLGGKPVLLDGWEKLICRGVLWLRSLDIRLLRALAGLLEVRIEFALTPSPPEQGGQKALQRLMQATAKALEAPPHPKHLEIAWHDLKEEGGPLKDLIASHLDPSIPYEGQGADRVELVASAGRYGLAEEMVKRAFDLVSSGIPPHEVALVFPDLDVYGPMLADAARRLRLPLDFSAGMPLGRTPLVQSILNLLELPLVHYERRALADVWDSPYLREPLERLCLGPGEKLPKDLGYVLKRSGYLDSRDFELGDWLDKAALREEAKKEGNKRRAGEYRVLAKACKNLKVKISIITQDTNIKEYCNRIFDLVRELGPAIPLPSSTQDLGDSCAPDAAIQARDHTAKNAFLWTIQDIAKSAEQAKSNEKLTPGRLLALLREVLNQTRIKQGNGAVRGISVHRLSETMGIKPRVVLLGGLNQGEFPIRPQGQNLLSSAQRLKLGKKATRPVWRADDEEYEGQLLQLAWLLANCSEGAVLGAARADLSGRQQPPSFILEDTVRLLGRELPAPSGGVFGELPQLVDAGEATALWGRLSAMLMRPLRTDIDIAQAALWHLSKKPKEKMRWQDLANRGQEEDKQNKLNRLSLGLRASHGDAFSGCLTSEQVLTLLAKVLSDPKFRELSPTSLETYAGCPLAWYFSYLLKLKVLSEPSWALEAKSEGDWVHRALANFFSPDEFDPNWDPAEQTEHLQRSLNQARLELSDGLAALPAVWEARYEVLQSTLAQVVAKEMEAMSGVLLWAVEQKIGAGFNIPVDQGPPLSLKGRLDRLDQGMQHIVISDYKHTTNEAGLRNAADTKQAGISQFQLPIYMAAALEMMGGEGKAITGRLVPTLLTSSKVREMAFAADDGFFSKDPRFRARLAKEGQPNLYNAIAALWRRLISGVFVALPDQQVCQYCDYRLACRAQATNET